MNNCTHCKCFHNQGEACCWCADSIACYQDEEEDEGVTVVHPEGSNLQW